MSTRLTTCLALGGLTLLLALSAPTVTAAAPTDREDSARVERDAEANLPSDGRSIIATVIAVDESAGRVTVDTPHGRVDLTMNQELAGQLTPGDVVVLRFTDDDQDSPSASPRETPPARAPANRI